MTSIILRRFKTLRQNGQPVTTFFSNRDNGSHLRSIPRTRFPSASFGTLSAYDLTHVPAAYNPHASIAAYSSASRSHRTRAADIGEGGRRLGPGLSDHNVDMGEKDVLPAYDKHGGPPRYIDTLPVLVSADSREGGTGLEQTRGPAPNYSPVSEAHSDSHDDNDSLRVVPT
ncbi:hypothetical protein BDP27DRAFT_1337587 [Rhodocollybia butyracea]|uniref:Uncharacterized protein n=1 Tax=Rhodocollybia butyracea TaxID=206335 RepID=A0A9P5U0G0_9AGAR|nr:hypothetical protein BDP27DRAFT_1337587 [Rhodocollybia butyracea]